MRYGKTVIGLMMVLAGLAQVACTPDQGAATADAGGQAVASTGDAVTGGRLEEARAGGAQVATEEGAAGKGAVKRWQEVVDQGDDPLTPGCACQHELPNCGGPIIGRAVDECFPKDGVTLNEKTVPTGCDTYSDKQYDCEKLLGKGAKCKLVEMDCCGVATTSAYCYLDITLKK
jgi:hypothetical protein